MSKRYPGNFITGNPVALSQTSNNGVWDLKDNYAAVGNDTWQAAASGSYEIPRSLRFRNSSPAYLTRTPATAGNRRIWTRSFWVKRGASGDGTSGFHYFTYNAGASSPEVLDFYTNSIRVYFSGGTYLLETTQKFRDYSAWYHIVVAVDTTQASAANRVKLYVNGSQITTWTTFTTVPQNFDCNTNNTVAHTIGYNGASNYFDGYMAEMYLIDGQQLDPSYFGYKDSITGIWQPKKYTGSYGTNGFYLPFNENQSLLNLSRNVAGTNLLKNSQTFDTTGSGGWAVGAAGITANVTPAPDGTMTADFLYETVTGASQHYVLGNSNVSTSAFQNSVVTLSVYAKAGTRTAFQLSMTDNTISATGAVFDLSTGRMTDLRGDDTAWSNTQGRIINVGNGWYRCILTATHGGLNGIIQPVFYLHNGTALANSSYSGDGTSGLYLWGAQMNMGATADAYIPTTTSAANNDFTPSGISVTAGATYDSMVDSPTNVFTSATDIGGVVSGNYATLNPLFGFGGGTITNGNLSATTGSTTVYGRPLSTLGMSTGKWYCEVYIDAVGSSAQVGISGGIMPTGSTGLGGSAGELSYNSSGNKYIAAVSTSFGATFTTGDLMGIAYDADTGSVTFYKNNVSQGSLTVPDSGTGIIKHFAIGNGGGTNPQYTVNFGQRPFAYAPPTGFKSLNTTNIQALGTSAVGSAAIRPNKWFDTVLYGGTGAARTITNPGGFVPDLVWTKVRNTTYSYNLVDSVRGAGVRLSTDNANAEGANANGGVTSFNTTNNNGYNIDGGVEVNENGRPYVSWQWKASPASGLNIVTYTGTGVSRSISHNLGVAPSMIWIKTRDTNAYNWQVYNKYLGTPATNVLILEAINAETANSGAYGVVPTSSSFTVGTNGDTNGSGKAFVAYLWAEVPGFSKFGSYIGNGSATDGPFVYCGFRPKFVLCKRYSGTTGNWPVFDDARIGYNPANNDLYTNLTQNEATSAFIDIVSNGFKVHGVSGEINQNTHGYIFMAFAESPLALNNRAR